MVHQVDKPHTLGITDPQVTEVLLLTHECFRHDRPAV